MSLGIVPKLQESDLSALAEISAICDRIDAALLDLHRALDDVEIVGLIRMQGRKRRR
jgi:hypothetical protein